MNLFYVKTTETCNLNCKHCFTSGSKGAKIFWNVDKVIDWFKRYRDHVGERSVHFEFHGGEPFLAKVSDMNRFYEETKDLWNDYSYGVTTNLTFKLTDEIRQFIKGPLENRLATSWDSSIRFANMRQYDLWRSNVKSLLEDGVTVKLFVSVTKDFVQMDQKEFILWIKELGVSEVSFERLTKDGNANEHPEIFPTNIELQNWFVDLHNASVELDARKWFTNETLESIYTKFENNINNSSTFCRDCEEKLFTLNPDGTIAGCANSAPSEAFGRIEDDIETLLTAPKRIETIACEVSRDLRCYQCDFFALCNGDCHRLEWEGDVCAAPKKLYRVLSSQINKRRTIPILQVSQNT